MTILNVHFDGAKKGKKKRNIMSRLSVGVTLMQKQKQQQKQMSKIIMKIVLMENTKKRTEFDDCILFHCISFFILFSRA